MKKVEIEQSHVKLTQKQAAELIKKGQMSKQEFEVMFIGKFKNHIRKIKALFNRPIKTGTFNTNQVDKELSSKMSAGLHNPVTSVKHGEVYQIKEQKY
jgi:hypothetical protein